MRADIVINPRKEDALKHVLDLTDGYGCDVYIEATGHPDAVVQGLQMIRKLGTFVEFSVMREPVTADWTIIGDSKEIDIHGAHLGPYTYPIAIDYIKRELTFGAAVGVSYMLIVPGAVGRPVAYDDSEFERSTKTLGLVADLFVQHKINAAIEPIRAAEVSFCHTVADAKRYIVSVNHAGVQHINGDVYHMQVGESHIGMAIMDAGNRLVNLHMADSNRCALGEGSLDLDTLIMALYVIGYNQPGCYVTPEPLGSGGDPYPAMHGKPDAERLDRLVNQTATYFREREDVVRDL